MSYELRPLSIEATLDRTLKILAGNFLQLTSIMALAYVPYMLLIELLSPVPKKGVDPVLGPADFWPNVVGALFLLLLLPPTQLAVTRAVLGVYLGQAGTVSDAFRGGRSAFAPYLGTTLLAAVLMIPLVLMLFLPALYFAVGWMLIGPIAVVERTYGALALKRSHAILRGGSNFWRAAGVLAFSVLLVGLLSGLVSALLGEVPFFGPVLDGLVQSVATAFSCVAAVVVYLEVRCRDEGFNLEQLGQRMGQPPQPTASPTPPETSKTPAAPTEQRPTGASPESSATSSGASTGVSAGVSAGVSTEPSAGPSVDKPTVASAVEPDEPDEPDEGR